MKKNIKSFTLVEVMIVVSIIAILAAIAIPNLLRARINASEASAKASLKTISSALENYFAIHGIYPTDLNDLRGSTPPYLTVDYFSGTHNSYTFTANMTNFTYDITAAPSSGLTGLSSFTMTTGAVITEN